MCDEVGRRGKGRGECAIGQLQVQALVRWIVPLHREWTDERSSGGVGDRRTDTRQRDASELARAASRWCSYLSSPRADRSTAVRARGMRRDMSSGSSSSPQSDDRALLRLLLQLICSSVFTAPAHLFPAFTLFKCCTPITADRRTARRTVTLRWLLQPAREQRDGQHSDGGFSAIHPFIDQQYALLIKHMCVTMMLSSPSSCCLGSVG